MCYLNDANGVTFGILDWHAQNGFVFEILPVVD